MTGQNFDKFEPLMKDYYHSQRVMTTTLQKHPTLALINKKEDWRGKNWEMPLIYADTAARSRTFTEAQARSRASGTESSIWTIPSKKDYALASIDGETMDRTEGDDGAFISAVDAEFKSAFRQIGNSMGRGIFGTSDGHIGQVAEEPAVSSGTWVLKFKDSRQIKNVGINAVVEIYQNKTGGSARTSDGTDADFVVAKVDYDAGQITLTGDYSASGDIATDDYIFIKGDRGLSLAGFLDWIPWVAPQEGDPLFFGINRSLDPNSFAGHRHDAANMPIEEGIIEASAKMADRSKSFDHFVINPRRLGDLKKSLGTKIQYVNLQASPTLSFSGILIDGDFGPIKVISDPDCPFEYSWGLTLENWHFCSIGQAPKVLNRRAGGGDGRTIENQDGVEFRWGYYGNLGCSDPSNQMIVKW